MSRSASAQVEIVAVADSKPQFTQSTYRGTIEEERDPGTMVLKVSPSDYYRTSYPSHSTSSKLYYQQIPDSE